MTVGRPLIESEGHLILVVCPSFVYDSVCPSGCSQQSWALRVPTSLLWGPIFIYHLQDFRSVCLLKNGVLMSSLSPFSLPSREWPSIFIIKGRGEAGFTFPPEHKHFIARGMWVIAVGGNVPLSKIRSYLNISGCSSQLSPAEAFIGMYGGAYTVVTFNTILDYRGQ